MLIPFIIAAIIFFVTGIAFFATRASDPYKYGGKKEPEQSLDEWQRDFFPKFPHN